MAIELITTNDEAILNLSTVSAIEMDELKNTLVSLTHSTTSHLKIHGDAMTEEQAKEIVNYLKEAELASFTVEITLPAHLEQNKIQIELDNLISNHCLDKNNQQIAGSLPSSNLLSSQSIKEEPKTILRPKKVKPKIEITLYDQSAESPREETIVVKPKAPSTKLVEPAKLERSPMAASIINELLTQDIFQAEKNAWEQIKNRSEAQAFRKNFPITQPTGIQDHPIQYLLRDNEALQHKLNQWTETLKLEVEQYNALLDVIGQYGIAGLESLFKTWEYDNDSFKKASFQETHALLLKYMPSYLPFIQDKAFNETIAKIANLSAEKRSWWVALVKNHVDSTNGYSNLPYLFKVFTETTVAIEEMNLPFYSIDTIKDKRDLPSTLSNMIAVLKKCPEQDREVQWKSISNVNLPEQTEFHFIIPEMKLEENHPDLLEIKTRIDQAQTAESDPNSIKPAFYRYIATQKQHLSLKQYEQIIDELFTNTNLTNQNKLRMVYFLAKTTSADKSSGFDNDNVYKEWKSFQVRTIEVKYMERVIANRSGFAKLAITKGIESRGGYPDIRNKLLKPLMNMPSTPPMSFLNKLLNLSEYKFLNPDIGLLEFEPVQEEMQRKMDQAAALYSEYPDVILKAIRLVNNKAVQANSQGQFLPETKDMTLLEQFVSACTTFIDKKHNTLSNEDLNPLQVLLPLLTTFHLEYESNATLEQVINRYKERVSGPDYQDAIQNLLPYALSLLQLIKDREQPSKLDFNTLDTIQDELLSILRTPNPVSKKQVREWLHQHYGQHFDGNILLDIKDEVNFDALFNRLECQNNETRRAIENVVSNFDEDEEKDYHTELATDLVELSKQLSPEQNTKFFEYCKAALKTNGILSRNKQDVPPTYIQQFRTLVQTLTSTKAIAEFEQYLIVSKENALLGGTDKNHLAKCDYLITTLYPALLEKGIGRKEAFNFTAKLVCQSPVQALYNSYEQVSYAATLELNNQELSDLERQITIFINSDRTPNGLLELRNKIEAIIALAPKDSPLFSHCRKIKTVIDEINTEIESKTADYNSKDGLEKAWVAAKSAVDFVSKNNWMGAWLTVQHLTEYSPTITEADIARLQNEGLLTLVNDTENDINIAKLKMNTRFQDVVSHLYDKKEELINKYSTIAIRANDFIAKALSLSPEDISKNYNDICQLIDNLIALDEQNLVLSVMYHYAGGLPGRGVKDIVELCNTPEYQSLASLGMTGITLQKDFINAIVSQMNNNVQCGKEDINAFLTFVCQNKENQVIMDCMHDFYQQAPYPSLEKFKSWAEKYPNDREAINGVYELFDKNPCALENGHDGREKDNGFKIAKAKQVAAEMQLQHLFTEEFLKDIELQSENAKTLSSQSILQELQDYKNNPHQNHIRLVMLAAELMHRAKGRPPEFVGDVQMPGRSFELNTTQIMAILAMFEMGRKVTAEIGTGEGKTRILMIINACQFLKGNTVDFLTSDLALAERDYLESLPFFKSLTENVNFTTATSKFEEHKIGGIYTSDPENFYLFLKNAFLQNKAHLVLDPDMFKRALTVDESDVNSFDMFNIKFHIATKTPQINIDLVPFFPLLMEFFAQSDTENTYFENKKRCTEQLLDFIEARNPGLYDIVKTVKVDQLEKWLNSAFIARHIEYNVDYTVVSEATISTELGTKKVAAAKCLIGSRISENAQFADGVHACLQAELNRLMKAPDSEALNPYLKEILGKCKDKERQFNIDPQRQIATTTTAHIMFKEFAHGPIMAVTGSAGIQIEKREVDTHHIKVPRHKGLHRYDRPINVCNSREAYWDAFVTSLLEAREKNEASMVLCKDDNESRELYDALKKRLESKKDHNGLPKITRIHASTDYEDGFSEAAYIKKEAGKPGQITITTEMESRGVDVITGKEGLRLLYAYLPKDERKYTQGVGRSGRFGQNGNSQMILNLETLKQDFGIDHLNTDFYLNPEAFIRRLQIFATITNKIHRLFSKGFDDLLAVYTQKYEQLMQKDENLAESWSQFLEQFNLSQENAQRAIEVQIQQEKPNIHDIEEKLAQHCQKAAELWDAFTESLPEVQRALLEISVAPELKKPKELDEWLKTMKELQEQNIYKVEVIETRNVKIHEKYEAATSGRATIQKYPAFFIPNLIAWARGEGELFPNLQQWWAGELEIGDMFAFWINIRDWWNGEGLLFPNFNAWLSGDLSFKNMVSQWPIFRYFIDPEEETHEVKITVPATHAYFLSKDSELLDEEDTVSNDKEQQREPVHFKPLFASKDNEAANQIDVNPEVEADKTLRK